MPRFDPTNTDPRTLYQRAYRARNAERIRAARAAAHAARVAGGWVDGRFNYTRGHAAGYTAVRDWRHRNAERVRVMDRCYKGMRRNELFRAAWPIIMRHYGNRCLACRTAVAVSPDHVVSLLNDPDTLNCLANLQPLCRSCNARKREQPTDHRHDRGRWIRTHFGKRATACLHPQYVERAPRTRRVTPYATPTGRRWSLDNLHLDRGVTECTHAADEPLS